MKTRLTILLPALVCIAAVGMMCIQPGRRVSAQQGNQQRLRALYDNDAIFNQLSGAARSRLELLFGKKTTTSPTRKPGSGPIIDAPATPPGRIQPQTALANNLVNNPAADPGDQDTQSETALVLGAGNNVVAAFNDSGSFTGINQHFTGIAQSSNMGTSWTDLGALPDDLSGDGDLGDPVLVRNNTTGRIFLVTLSFSGEKLQAFPSDDNGLTYGQPINTVPGLTGTGDFVDKPWAAVDNFAGPGQGNVYVAARNFATSGARDGITFARSTDGGATFGPNQGLLLAAGGQGTSVAVGTDHSVYVFWYNSSTSPRRLTVRKSTDFGATFGPTIDVASLLGTGVNGNLGLEFRTNSFPMTAVNPVNGHLYVTYNDNPAGADRGDIYFTMSADGGTTWSVPVRANNDAGTKDQTIPAIAVTPDGTKLCIGWYDRRNDPANSLLERYGVIGTIAGATVTFGNNFKISPPFPVVVGVDPVINITYMGDYDQMAADNNFFYTTWGDNRDNNLANTRKNANIRFAKIPVAGPGPVAEFQSFALSGGDGNGVVDVNECNLALNVTVTNNGTTAASGVSATITTATPGVTILQGTAAYPDLPVSGSGANLTPFAFATTPAFVCGTTIVFDVTVSYTGGSDTFSFNVGSGALGVPVAFESTNVPLNIIDVGTINSVNAVSGVTGAIGDINVSFHLTHTFDSDLNISLIGPDGTTIDLTSGNGGSGDNYGASCASRVVFDDAAATPITAGVAPFNGTFRPEQALAAFNGKSGAAVNGNWTLRITDTASSDVGVLQCWSLTITPLTCTTSAVGCCPAITLSPPTLPQLFAGVPYSQTLTPAGGGAPYTFTLDAGALPAGLTLSPGGVIQGTTLLTSGVFPFVVKVTDGMGCMSLQSYTLNPICAPLSLAPTLANGVQGTAYSQSVVVGPTNGYNFAVTTNILPPGLTLNAATGEISGTPSAPGNYTFAITATIGGVCPQTRSYNVLITGICSTITVNPATLPGGTLGTAYPATNFTAAGGVAPYSFSVSSGALPAGLSLSGAGALSGTPTAAGTFVFTVKAVGQGGCAGTRQYVLSIACSAFSFSPATLPNGAKGAAYSQAITVTPGAGHTFSLQTGSLPPGFTLSAAGLLSGITNQAGTWTFTVKALLGSCQGTKQYTLTIPSMLAPTAALAQRADYDGDGRSDFVLWANGAWRLSLSSGGAARQAQTQSWGTAGDLSLLGDYDGDGLTDFAVFRPGNGTWYVKQSGDGSVSAKAWGLATDVPVPGDYDGDRQTDIAVFRPSEGNWYVLRSSDQQYQVTAWGAGYAPYYDVAVPGDYDGDGQTDLAVFRRATGTWLVKRSSDGQFSVKDWGLGTDVPVAADYDGDGKMDFAVWRMGTWYIWQSAHNSARKSEWGASYAPYFDQAVPGDYDGDGQTDLAVWRVSEQTWYVLCSLDSSALAQAHGQTGDAPVPRK